MDSLLGYSPAITKYFIIVKIKNMFTVPYPQNDFHIPGVLKR